MFGFSNFWLFDELVVVFLSRLVWMCFDNPDSFSLLTYYFFLGVVGLVNSIFSFFFPQNISMVPCFPFFDVSGFWTEDPFVSMYECYLSYIDFWFFSSVKVEDLSILMYGPNNLGLDVGSSYDRLNNGALFFATGREAELAFTYIDGSWGLDWQFWIFIYNIEKFFSAVFFIIPLFLDFFFNFLDIAYIKFGFSYYFFINFSCISFLCFFFSCFFFSFILFFFDVLFYFFSTLYLYFSMFFSVGSFMLYLDEECGNSYLEDFDGSMFAIEDTEMVEKYEYFFYNDLRFFLKFTLTFFLEVFKLWSLDGFFLEYFVLRSFRFFYFFFVGFFLFFFNIVYFYIFFELFFIFIPFYIIFIYFVNCLKKVFNDVLFNFVWYIMIRIWNFVLFHFYSDRFFKILRYFNLVPVAGFDPLKDAPLELGMFSRGGDFNLPEFYQSSFFMSFVSFFRPVYFGLYGFFDGFRLNGLNLSLNFFVLFMFYFFYVFMFFVYYLFKYFIKGSFFVIFFFVKIFSGFFCVFSILNRFSFFVVFKYIIYYFFFWPFYFVYLVFFFFFTFLKRFFDIFFYFFSFFPSIFFLFYFFVRSFSKFFFKFLLFFFWKFRIFWIFLFIIFFFGPFRSLFLLSAFFSYSFSYWSPLFYSPFFHSLEHCIAAFSYCSDIVIYHKEVFIFHYNHFLKFWAAWNDYHWFFQFRVKWTNFFKYFHVLAYLVVKSWLVSNFYALFQVKFWFYWELRSFFLFYYIFYLVPMSHILNFLFWFYHFRQSFIGGILVDAFLVLIPYFFELGYIFLYFFYVVYFFFFENFIIFFENFIIFFENFFVSRLPVLNSNSIFFYFSYIYFPFYFYFFLQFLKTFFLFFSFFHFYSIFDVYYYYYCSVWTLHNLIDLNLTFFYYFFFDFFINISFFFDHFFLSISQRISFFQSFFLGFFYMLEQWFLRFVFYFNLDCSVVDYFFVNFNLKYFLFFQYVNPHLHNSYAVDKWDKHIVYAANSGSLFFFLKLSNSKTIVQFYGVLLNVIDNFLLFGVKKRHFFHVDFGYYLGIFLFNFFVLSVIFPYFFRVFFAAKNPYGSSEYSWKRFRTSKLWEIYRDLTVNIPSDVEAFILRGSGFLHDIRHKSDKYVFKQSNEFGLSNPFWLYARLALDVMGRADGFSRGDFKDVMSKGLIGHFMRHQINSIGFVLHRFYYVKFLSWWADYNERVFWSSVFNRLVVVKSVMDLLYDVYSSEDVEVFNFRIDRAKFRKDSSGYRDDALKALNIIKTIFDFFYKRRIEVETTDGVLADWLLRNKSILRKLVKRAVSRNKSLTIFDKFAKSFDLLFLWSKPEYEDFRYSVFGKYDEESLFFDKNYLKQFSAESLLEEEMRQKDPRAGFHVQIRRQPMPTLDDVRVAYIKGFLLRNPKDNHLWNAILEEEEFRQTYSDTANTFKREVRYGNEFFKSISDFFYDLDRDLFNFKLPFWFIHKDLYSQSIKVHSELFFEFEDGITFLETFMFLFMWTTLLFIKYFRDYIPWDIRFAFYYYMTIWTDSIALMFSYVDWTIFQMTTEEQMYFNDTEFNHFVADFEDKDGTKGYDEFRRAFRMHYGWNTIIADSMANVYYTGRDLYGEPFSFIPPHYSEFYFLSELSSYNYRPLYLLSILSLFILFAVNVLVRNNISRKLSAIDYKYMKPRKLRLVGFKRINKAFSFVFRKYLYKKLKLWH
jgi:hypothetical protein